MYVSIAGVAGAGLLAVFMLAGKVGSHKSSYHVSRK
jgi:hypothetical protein